MVQLLQSPTRIQLQRSLYCTATSSSTAQGRSTKVVVDGEENKPWQRLKIHTVRLVQYIGKGTEGLQNMSEVFQAENEGIVIPTQVRWLVNPCTIRDSRLKGEIAKSSVDFVANMSWVGRGYFKKGIVAAGVWNRVETCMNEGPDSSR